MKTRLSLIVAALAIFALGTAAPASAEVTPTLTISWAEGTPIPSQSYVRSEPSFGECVWSTCGVQP